MIELFDCKALSARISIAQCRTNRSRPLASSFGSVPIRPEACRKCTQWMEFDVPEGAGNTGPEPEPAAGAEVDSVPVPVATPCVGCRFFRPLPTYYNGVPGIRLCWAERQAWDFACYHP